MRGEKQDDEDDVHEAFDVILPQENVHSHLDRQNGQESAYEEPLDESEDYDYPQLNREYLLINYHNIDLKLIIF